MVNASYILFMIIIVLIMFTLMVVSHEWGHYIMAKKNGVQVHEFAVGMGPILWSKQKGETLYAIRLFPIGGFCRMEDEMGQSDNPRAMAAKKPWQKFVILVAGAVMNFALAWLLMSIYVGYIGFATNVVDQVQVGTPAAQAGLLSGDRIIAINGVTVKDLNDVSAQISKEPQTYTLTIERNKEKMQLEVVTNYLEEGASPRFGFSVAKQHFNLLKNITSGFKGMIMLIVLVWQGFVELITGTVGMDQMAGIVGIVDAGSQVWDSGMQNGGIVTAVMNMVYMTALLSANLGVVNLLPLPALDGGRIIFVLIEMIRGKAISAEKEGAVHFIGMVLLMLLTIVVMYNDIMRIVK